VKHSAKRRRKILLTTCLLAFLLLPGRMRAGVEAGNFHCALPRAIRSYSDNEFLLEAPEAGRYRIIIRDETTTYQMLTGEVETAGPYTVRWNGTGFNDERLEQRKYWIDASFETREGKQYSDQLTHTIGYGYQAVNFALPSSAVLNLNAINSWFMEVKVVQDGSIIVEWIPEKETGAVLSRRQAVAGGKVLSFRFAELMGSSRPSPGAYLVHVYDPRNPDYGKSFSVQVTDEPIQTEKIQETGEILPEEGASEREIWDMMMRPSVVVDIGFHQHQKIYQEPDSRSPSLGTVHGQTQGLKVLDTQSEPGWVRVGAWVHENGQYTEGWVPSEKLILKHPETDYGLLFDKQKQTLDVFYRGKRLDTLKISTGSGDSEHPDRETPAGSYLTGTHRGSFSSNGKKFDYVIQYDGGNMIHQIPYRWGNGKKDFSPGAADLGQKASHGCIRVQAEPTAKEGLNAYWLWTHIPFQTRVIILDD